MISLFGGRLNLGRLPDEQQRHNELLRKLKKIMATLKEVTDQFNEANASLTAANSIISETKAIIVKVGAETDNLKEQIANLPTGDASPELVAALEGIKATVASTSALVAEAKDAAGVVDAKVPDEAPPTP